MKHLTRLRL